MERWLRVRFGLLLEHVRRELLVCLRGLVEMPLMLMLNKPRPGVDGVCVSANGSGRMSERKE